MSKTIFLFVKVFNNEKYANDFVKGKLFSNRLSYFKELEENDNADRADAHEGIVGWYQPEKINIELNGNLITGLAGPASIHMHWQGFLNVFCIYAIHSGAYNEVSTETMESFRKELEVPKRTEKLGEFAVIVTNVTEFIERISDTIKNKNYALTAGLVEYYNPNIFHGTFIEAESVFKKRDEYQHQKEYRFSIDTGLEGKDPIILDIGNISDITICCKVKDINDLIKINLRT